MRSFNLGSLDEWEPLAVGELLDDASEIEGPRSLWLRLVSDAPVSVFVTDEVAGRRLVAYGDGLMRVRTSVSGPAQLDVEGDEGAEVFVQRRTEAQVVPDAEQPSFTTIEPRGAGGPALEVRRMMLAMRINAERRERLLETERAELAARVAELEKGAQRPAPRGSEPNAPPDPA